MRVHELELLVDRRRTVFSNGLRVVSINRPGMHRASVSVYARVGSRYETLRTNGLSHLVEHMIFRGSEHFPDATSYAAATERIGGTLCAETGLDYSLYQLSVPREEVDQAILLLGDVFARPRFTDLEVEKRIIQEEILEDQDETGRDVNVDNIARATAWPRNPMGLRITGPADNVARFTLADIHAHFARFYGARNLLVCVCGAVNHERVVRSVRRAFGGLPAGRAMRPQAAPPLARSPRLACVATQGSQTSVEVLVRALPDTDEDFPALVAALRILDDGLATRLHRRIVDELGLAYNVSAGHEAFEGIGLLEIQAQVAHENSLRIVDEILHLFDDIRQQGVTEEELANCQRRYRWDLLSLLDDPDAIAAWFGGGEMFRPVETLLQRLSRIQSVRRQDVLRVARRVFDRRRLTVAVVGEVRRSRSKIARMLERYA